MIVSGSVTGGLSTFHDCFTEGVPRFLQMVVLLDVVRILGNNPVNRLSQGSGSRKPLESSIVRPRPPRTG